MDFKTLRERMVKEQIISRGIKDNRVITALSQVPRHLFISPQYSDSAYRDHPLPLGEGQTISQPYMVALMTEWLGLEGGENVLEIGTGSGYQTAILAQLSKQVYSVERITPLAQKARTVLEQLKYKNIHIKIGDGSLGWVEHAPYDAIIVTAAAPKVPSSLLSQLKKGGRLIIPIGEAFSQTLTLAQKKEKDITYTDVCGCVFVPLLGQQGWQDKKL